MWSNKRMYDPIKRKYKEFHKDGAEMGVDLYKRRNRRNQE